MTVRYVGKGGSDSADGLSWANRKLTLNGAEDSPVVAGDIIYVGPGVYREMLTCDVSGTAGNWITYVGDVTGVYTDGIGEAVTITASDDDISATRSRAVYLNATDYRRFEGFTMFAGVNDCLNGYDIVHAHLENCTFMGNESATVELVNIRGPLDENFYVGVKNCIFIGATTQLKLYSDALNQFISYEDVESCLFIGGRGGGTTTYGIWFQHYDDFTAKNCTFIGLDRAVSFQNLDVSIGGGRVYNCLFDNNGTALYSDGTGAGTKVIENFNNVSDTNEIARTNINTGSDSVAYATLYSSPILHEALARFPWLYGELLSRSSFTRRTGTAADYAANDLYDIVRPTTNAKRSWGAFQFQEIERETTTVHDSSVASIKLPDAARHQIFLPVKNSSTTISVYCYRETNYAGTLPQLVVKEPGQSSRTDTDTGSSGVWNQLSINFTPAVNTNFVVVELVSNNTAISGSYAAFFDTLGVS
jgi:hypothetical protein